MLTPRFTGSMNAKLRGDAVDDFRDPNKDIRIMLVSLKAGNAGLNLNAANNVIILDPFWYLINLLLLALSGAATNSTLQESVHRRTGDRSRPSLGADEGGEGATHSRR